MHAKSFKPIVLATFRQVKLRDEAMQEPEESLEAVHE